MEVLLKSTMAIDNTESIVRFNSVFLSVAEEGDCGVREEETRAVSNRAKAKMPGATGTKRNVELVLRAENADCVTFCEL